MGNQGLINPPRKSNELVRKIVPPDQLLEIKLEDGLAWDEICPFLGDEVPDVPYPRANDPQEFKRTIQGIMASHWRQSLWTGLMSWGPFVAFALAAIPAWKLGVRKVYRW